MLRGSRVLVGGVLALACAARAQAGISLDALPAVPRDGHAVVWATVTDGTAGTPCVLFRRAGFGDPYYVDMVPAGEGRHWAVLPRPVAATDRVELVVATRLDDGRLTERTEAVTVPVRGSAAPLAPEHAAAARNLEVGSTRASQVGEAVAWFSPEGIAPRAVPGGGAAAAPGGGGDTTSKAMGQGDAGAPLTNVIIIGRPGPISKETSLPRP